MSARALAAVLFTAVGLYAVVLGIWYLGSAVNILAFQAWGTKRGTLGSKDLELFCTALAAPCLLFGLGLLLIFRPPQQLMNRAGPDPDSPQVGPSQASAILIVGMVLIGVFLVGTAGSRLIGLLGQGFVSPAEEGYVASPGFWTRVIEDSIQLCIGVYLLFGAPGICRWQMKRIRESSAEGPAAPLGDGSGLGGGTG